MAIKTKNNGRKGRRVGVLADPFAQLYGIFEAEIYTLLYI